jgi:hypothetical protein
VKWSDVKILGEMCVLSLIYSYVAACRFYAVRCVIIISFCLLFSNDSPYVFNIHFCLFSRFVFFYFVYSVLLYYFVYCFSFCIQLSLAYFCTSLPTAGTGCKLNCSNTSYHLYNYSLHQGSKSKGNCQSVNPYVPLSSHIHIHRPYFANRRQLNVAQSGR